MSTHERIGRTAVNALRSALADVEQLERERDEARAEAQTAKARVAHLEDVVRWFTWFADTHNGVGSSVALTRARAALLGMDHTDADAVAKAWGAQ